MTWSEIAVLVIVIVAIGLTIAVTSARRLDRLHRKVVASRLALDSQLLRRAHATGELAASGLLDPVSSVLLADATASVIGVSGDGDHELITAMPDLSELVAAHRDAQKDGLPRLAVNQALSGSLGDGREARESGLTAVVDEVIGDKEESAALYLDEDGAALLGALSSAWYRVQLARRFHNESVLQAQRVRSNPLVRFFRLAGYAAMPTTVELDDGWPAGLRQVTSLSARPANSPSRSQQ